MSSTGIRVVRVRAQRDVGVIGGFGGLGEHHREKDHLGRGDMEGTTGWV